jgi:large subunit ribosomal protein L10
MPISRKRKEELVARYVDLLKNSQGIVITQNTGMTMDHFDEVRAKLREINSTYLVTKNTLFRLALEEVEMPVPEELLKGPVVVAFAGEDVGSTAKAVLNFGEDVEVFSVTGALVDGEIYDESGVEALSKLPSLTEIQAQLVGLIIAPAAGLVNVLNSGTTQVLNVVAAYAAKEEEEAA